ncbi:MULTISPECIES: hypothetical protein [unclassified Butyrivibrio]|uniref:hypothetical protein n=1 Tax=unclassified Butyrivibrio TaxID=2639466 RepID=UPI0003B501BB|nr:MULTISPECIES: hypothetical protein [unclassified Butyrivibrio]MDC7292480.1 hypothetical protein [Butyrivibrio sp. DSM 10294]
MKTEAQIYMDFQKAKEQSSRLRQIASNLDNVADDEVQGAVTKIGADWTGENSDNYTGKAGNEKVKINTTAANVKKVADVIEAIAARIMQAELAAIRIASH